MNTASILKLRRALLACALAATATASASHACAQEQSMQVKVPFAFHYGSQHMPAGVYRVQIESSHLILLRGQSSSGFLLTDPETTNTVSNTGKVVFQRYGEQYFLREVWQRGSSIGQRCVKSRQEREAQISQNWTSPITRELALNQLPR